MKKRKLLTSILAGILAAVMLLGIVGMIAPIVGAEKNSTEIQNEIDELEDKKAEIDDQIAELEKQLSSNMDEMEAIVAQKNIIDQEVFLLHQQVSNINAQISAYSDLIADKQEELDLTQARLEQLKAQNQERIRAMEKNGSLSYWSVIFKANNFFDLLDRLKMVQEIADADRRRMEQISLAAQAVAQAKGELETEKSALESTKVELNASQAQLEEKRAEADVLLAQLVAKGEEYEILVEEAESNAAQLEHQILEKQEEYDEAKDREYQEYLKKLQQQQQQQQQQQKPNYSGGTAGAPNTVGGVEWLVPISYTRFSSPFGYRIHPVYGDWRFHYGVDLSAPAGTPIYASRGGVVTTTAYEAGGAGYYVNIDHQDGFSSRYLHMTHYIVSPGQYVYAGQVIGYCGSTGASTGPHLHFSVYYNGTAVNPADYIRI